MVRNRTQRLERVFKLRDSIKNATSPPVGISSQGGWSRSDERALSQRPERATMAVDSTTCAETSQARTSADRSARDPQRGVVCGSHRLSVATIAREFSQVEDRVHGLLEMA